MADPKYGGEVITKKGKVFKFDDVICMIRFLKSGTLKPGDIKQNVVVNFEKKNDFIDVKDAILFTTAELKSPMSSNTAAFESEVAARFLKEIKKAN